MKEIDRGIRQEEEVLDELGMVEKPPYFEGSLRDPFEPHILKDVFVYGIHKVQVMLEARKNLKK